MRRNLSILFALGIVASFCHAETRWCSIVGRGPSDKFAYPPIARAARVRGVVISRIQFSSLGNVNHVETISGSPLLADSLASQIKEWTLKTDASGDETCQALVVADFRLLNEPPLSADQSTKPVAPSVLEIVVEVEPEPIVIENLDPLARSTRFRMAFHRMMAKVFGPNR